MFIAPPSTKTSPPWNTGGSTPGIATEARSHRHSVSLLVHGDAAGREVRRDAEERQRQVLDVDVAELAAQQHADLAPGHERHDRQRVVGQRIGVDEAALEALGRAPRGPIPTRRPRRGCRPCWCRRRGRSARRARAARAPRRGARSRARRRPRARGRPRGRSAAARRVRSRRAPRTWWWAMPGSAACQRAAAPRANPPSCRSRSSARRMLPSAHRAAVQAASPPDARAASSTTSAWRRQSCVHGVSPASAA